MPISTAGNRRNKQRGFTYVLVLVGVIVMGIAAETASVPVSRRLIAEREQELLFRGQAYRDAIRNYYAVARRYPRSLKDLLKDPGSAHRCYLRTLYPDPMSADGKGEWRLVRAADGGIAGVASQSTDLPMKQANFPPGWENFADARSYADWVFEYSPNATAKTKKGSQ
jgi:type II secretory pathway pseudopilin PulG